MDLVWMWGLSNESLNDHNHRMMCVLRDEDLLDEFNEFKVPFSNQCGWGARNRRHLKALEVIACTSYSFTTHREREQGTRTELVVLLL